MPRLLLCLTMAALASLQAGAAPAAGGDAKISLSSTAFRPGGMIPARFTCKGANVNPPLAFQGVPAGAKSLLLIVDDPDAPDGLFTHWLVWNIAPQSTEVAAASLPSGAVPGTNDFDKLGYGGPCPPSGTHRYFFRLFALDRTLAASRGAHRGEIEKAIAGHILARGELMGRFSH